MTAFTLIFLGLFILLYKMFAFMFSLFYTAIKCLSKLRQGDTTSDETVIKHDFEDNDDENKQDLMTFDELLDTEELYED